jgi:hypothetical protein
MIHLNLSIANPFSTRWKPVFFKNGTLLRHKAWEFNCYTTHYIIDVAIHYTRNCDHAGLQLEFGLLGLGLEFGIYDTRHWDYETDRFNS